MIQQHLRGSLLDLSLLKHVCMKTQFLHKNIPTEEKNESHLFSDVRSVRGLSRQSANRVTNRKTGMLSTGDRLNI